MAAEVHPSRSLHQGYKSPLHQDISASVLCRDRGIRFLLQETHRSNTAVPGSAERDIAGSITSVCMSSSPSLPFSLLRLQKLARK